MDDAIFIRSAAEGLRVDQGQAEFLGFVALAVVLPVVAVLYLAGPLRSPLAAFAAVAGGSAALSAAAGWLYGVCLRLAFGRPEMNWTEAWLAGGLFGGAAGLGCGVMRAVELARRNTVPDAESGDWMKRRWLALVVVGVLQVAVVGAVWVGRSNQGLTDARAAAINAGNFQRIQVGMSAAEVNGILGVPPGDYRRPPGFLLVGHGHVPWTEQAGGGKLKVWYIPRYHVEVLFDRNGRVVGKHWHDYDAKQ